MKDEGRSFDKVIVGRSFDKVIVGHNFGNSIPFRYMVP